MPKFEDIVCEVCGVPSTEAVINMTFSKDGGTEIICESCKRWMRDGLIRVEYIDGKKHYRRWTYHIQPMTPTKTVWPAWDNA